MSELEPGTKVYLRWYDFQQKREQVLTGEVTDNAGYSDTQWATYVNVRIQPAGMSAPICHHFLPCKLSLDPNDVPHDDCYLISHQDDNRPSGSPRTKLQSFIQSHWDHVHNHLDVDCLEEYYRLYLSAITGQEVPSAEVQPQPSPPTVSTLAAAPSPEPQPQPVPVKNPTRKQQRSVGRIEYTDSIQTSFFD